MADADAFDRLGQGKMIDSTENGVATKMWRKKVMEEKESQQNAGDSILKDMRWV